MDFLLGADLDLIRADCKLGLGDEAHHDSAQQIRGHHNKLKLRTHTNALRRRGEGEEEELENEGEDN